MEGVEFVGGTLYSPWFIKTSLLPRRLSNHISILSWLCSYASNLYLKPLLYPDRLAGAFVGLFPFGNKKKENSRCIDTPIMYRQQGYYRSGRHIHLMWLEFCLLVRNVWSTQCSWKDYHLYSVQDEVKVGFFVVVFFTVTAVIIFNILTKDLQTKMQCTVDKDYYILGLPLRKLFVNMI